MRRRRDRRRAMALLLRVSVLLVLMMAVRAVPAAGAAAGAGGEREDLWPEVLDEQLEVLETEELEAFLAELDEDVRRHLPTLNLRELVLDPEEGFRLDLGELLTSLLRYLAREILLQSRLLGQLVILAVLCALLQSLGSAFANRGAADVAFTVTLLVVIFLAVQSFQAALRIGQETLETMVAFMIAMLPVLSTMLAAVGAVSSAALFHPLLITVVSMVATLINQVVFPLLFFAAALGIVGNLASEFPVSRLAALARQASIVLLGGLFTVFLGVMVVRGALAPVADGVAIRTAKFLTGTFVPVVGGMLADAVEVVVGGSLLIKNAVGALGLLAILLIAAFPVLQIFSILVIYRVVTALVQPISDPRLVDALGSIADTLTIIVAAVCTAALMFFLAVTVLVGVGNVAAMMR